METVETLFNISILTIKKKTLKIVSPVDFIFILIIVHDLSSHLHKDQEKKKQKKNCSARFLTPLSVSIF